MDASEAISEWVRRPRDAVTPTQAEPQEADAEVRKEYVDEHLRVACPTENIRSLLLPLVGREVEIDLSRSPIRTWASGILTEIEVAIDESKNDHEQGGVVFRLGVRGTAGWSGMSATVVFPADREDGEDCVHIGKETGEILLCRNSGDLYIRPVPAEVLGPGDGEV